MHATLAALTFIVTITLVIWRPRGIHEAVPAVAGAVALLAMGIISLHDVVTVSHIIWNATASLIAIMILTLVLDDVGFFHWMAIKLAKRSHGSPFRLFCAVFTLGSLVTILFNNDGSVLIITPIIYKLIQDLEIGPRTALPLLVTCGFIADTASVPLLISNLVNIVTTDFFRYNFAFYAARMILPGFTAIVASFICLAFFYRSELVGEAAKGNLPSETQVVKDWFLLRLGIVTLALIIVGYMLGAHYGIPVSAVAAIGSLIYMTAARVRRQVEVRKILRNAPWGIVFFALGMYLVVYGLRNVGLTESIGVALRNAMNRGLIFGTAFTGVVSALGAAAMNNLPATMTGALSIQQASFNSHQETWAALANVIGNDVGPKLTPIGSLSTLLWLDILRKRGVNISWAYYLKIGLVLTPPVLLASLLVLALSTRFGPVF